MTPFPIFSLRHLHASFIFIWKTSSFYLVIIGSFIYVVGPILFPSTSICNPPFPLHSYDLTPLSSVTGRPPQHGKALISCTTTFWISPARILWAAVAVSRGPRPLLTSQRTLIMTVYGRPTVTGWALLPVRAPTSPTKINLPLTPISNDLIFIWNYLFIYVFIRCPVMMHIYFGHFYIYLFIYLLVLF